MAYIENGAICLEWGDRIILQEKHSNGLYTFEKGEECEIKELHASGKNYYAIISLDCVKRVDGVSLGGLTDQTIKITHNVAGTLREGGPWTRKKNNDDKKLAEEILLHMFKFAGA